MHIARIDPNVSRLILKDRGIGPDLDGEAASVAEVNVHELLRTDELDHPNAPMGAAFGFRRHQAQILWPGSEHDPLAFMQSAGKMAKRHSGALARERRNPVF